VRPYSQSISQKPKSQLKYYISNKVNPNLNGGTIIFDEDNDEPLLPEPIFNDRSLLGSSTEARKTQVTSSSTVPKKKVAQQVSNKKQPISSTTEFQPILFDAPAEKKAIAVPEEQAKISAECVESQEGDCDEIIVEGSVYAPLLIRKPFIDDRKVRNRHRNVNENRFFLA
jgi:hypothetical protein